MTGETTSTLNDALNECNKTSAKLPIIKSECENRFIIGLMSKQKPWVWLGIQRKGSKMVWSDDTPAEVSDGAPYNGWNPNEPSSQANEDCAYLNFDQQGWNDNKCDHSPYGGP